MSLSLLTRAWRSKHTCTKSPKRCALQPVQFAGLRTRWAAPGSLAHTTAERLRPGRWAAVAPALVTQLGVGAGLDLPLAPSFPVPGLGAVHSAYGRPSGPRRLWQLPRKEPRGRGESAGIKSRIQEW